MKNASANQWRDMILTHITATDDKAKFIQLCTRVYDMHNHTHICQTIHTHTQLCISPIALGTHVYVYLRVSGLLCIVSMRRVPVSNVPKTRVRTPALVINTQTYTPSGCMKIVTILLRYSSISILHSDMLILFCACLLI